MASPPFPQLASEWTDFISDYMTYSEGDASTEIHRMWSGIALVAGACERRVWVRVGSRVCFPNLYVLLVAPPGSGKQIIDDVREIWRETEEPSGGKAFHVAPDNMTRASLIDELASATQTRMIPSAGRKDALENYTYHSLLIAAEEFEHFLPAWDSDYIATLNSIWNNKSEHRETRRHGQHQDVTISLPQLNIIGGVQPAYLAREFVESTWSTGIARRVIMVYSDELPLMDVFQPTPNREDRRQRLLLKLGLISEMFGEVHWSPEALEFARKWHLSGCPPEPTHSKLKSYNTSRTQQLAKLSTISAASRTASYTIDIIDVRRAQQWLIHAESVMPDIFRAMEKRSDKEILENLHIHVTRLWGISKKAVPTSSIYHYLSTCAPVSSIDKLIQVAERSNIIRKVQGSDTLWTPIPRDQHGLE